MTHVIITDATRRLEQSDLEWLTVEERAAFFGELKGYGQEKGYKTGWAALKYKDRFGEFPNDPLVRDARATDCGAETRLWIKSTMEGWWRRKPRD